MKRGLVSEWNAVMKDRFNTLKNTNLASCHYSTRLLAWMWSMIVSVSFLWVHHYDYVWSSLMLSIVGVFITLTMFKASKTNRVRPSPVLHLSRASKYVWKIDFEA